MRLGKLGDLLTYFLDLGVEVYGTLNQLGEFHEKVVEVCDIAWLVCGPTAYWMGTVPRT